MVVTSSTINLEKLVWGRRIEIPPIQRDYAWSSKGKDASADQLIRDLIVFHSKNKVGNYYLGNFIIVVENPDKLTELYNKEGTEDFVWSLLDGQQRLTSLTMIFNSIYIILNESSDPRAPHICNDIKSRFIFADESRFDTSEWGAAIFPRREETQEFLSWLLHDCTEDPKNYTSQDGSVTNIQEAAILFHKYIRKIYKKLGVDELIKFYDTLCKRVMVSLTITDEASMGFQMFQTANSRGTALTSYDMFRAFCIKRSQVDLQLPELNRLVVVQLLNVIEGYLNEYGKTDDARDTGVKSLMTAWMICRNGKRFTASVIIREIEELVESINSYSEMLGVINDLTLHAKKWLEYKSKTPMKREDAPGNFGRKGRKSWITIGRLEELGMTIFWPLVLSLRCAEDDENGSSTFICSSGKFKKSDSIIEMLQWTIIKGIVCKRLPIRGKSQDIENELVKDCNLIWNGYHKLDPMMDEEKIKERMQYWQLDHPKKENPTGFKDMELVEFHSGKDGNFKHAKILLHLLDSGMSDIDPRFTGQKIHVAKIFPPNNRDFNYIDEDFSNLLGNFILVRGSASGGVNKKFFEEDDMSFDERKKQLIKYSSDDSINTPLNHVKDVDEITRFIKIRSLNLKHRLEEKWKEFAKSQGIQLID
jgi:hypothetical protein